MCWIEVWRTFQGNSGKPSQPSKTLLHCEINAHSSGEGRSPKTISISKQFISSLSSIHWMLITFTIEVVFLLWVKRKPAWGWSDSLALKSTSFWWSRHGSSQLPSPGLREYCTHTVHNACKQTEKPLIYKTKEIIIFGRACLLKWDSWLKCFYMCG